MCVILGFALSCEAVGSQAEEKVTTIIACADFQPRNGDDWGFDYGKQTLKIILNGMKRAGITKADAFFACGDYSNTNRDVSTTNEGIAILKNSVSDIVTGDTIFVQGNHDSYGSGTVGLAPFGNNDAKNGAYGCFVIHEEQYDWFGEKKEATKQAAKDLEAYLNKKIEQKFTKPIFILTHIQLEFTNSYGYNYHNEAVNARYIFDVVNKAATKGLNIIFMHGHIHGNCCEDAVGGSSVFLTKGDKLKIANFNRGDYATETLNFTYMSPGYVGYYGTNSASADKALTMTVFKIYNDKVIISRYSENNGELHNLKSAGAGSCEHTAVNSKVIASPYTLPLTAGAKPIAAKITAGDGALWKKGSNTGISFTANGCCLQLRAVRINGNILDEDDYTITSEPMKLTVNPNYLNSLSAGDYKLDLVFKDNSCSASLKVTTNENNNQAESIASTESNINSATTNSSVVSDKSEQATTDKNTSNSTLDAQIDIDETDDGGIATVLRMVLATLAVVIIVIAVLIFLSLKRKV